MSESDKIQETIAYLRNRISVLEYTLGSIKSQQMLDSARYRLEILQAAEQDPTLQKEIEQMQETILHLNSISNKCQSLERSLNEQKSLFETICAEKERLEIALNEQKSLFETICAEKERLEIALNEQKSLFETIRTERDLMANSTSWKITSIFRRITDLTRRAAKKILPRRSVVNYKKHPVITFLCIFQIHKLIKWFFPKWYYARKARFVEQEFSSGVLSGYFEAEGWRKRKDNCNYWPLITIIVPNYNHAPFLKERLDSIYNQTYRNFEVLLMDDVSKDNSVEILKDYAARYSDRTKLLLNDTNSGSPFAQWRKGLEHASGELIWIAESDDYCELNFLEKMIPNFAEPSVMLSFARSIFVKNGEEVWHIEEYLQSDMFASGSFFMTADRCVKEYFSRLNIIPNVSSCIFRKPQTLKLLEDSEWNRMKVCGDWVFYLHLIRGGAIAYTAETTNYYRQHDSNTSISQHSQDRYYQEHQIVREHLAENYVIPEESQQFLKNTMREFWKLNRDDYSDHSFGLIFDDNKLRKCAAGKKPAIGILCYAFSTGGGEKVPIILANALKRNGNTVTFVNCGGEEDNPDVRSMLDRDIPLVNLDWKWENFYSIMEEYGIDCVHSHHASVDFAAAVNLPSHIAHIVTTHGMYETIPENYLVSNLKTLIDSVNIWLYIADKNLDVIKKYVPVRNNFLKTFNAVIPPESVRSRDDVRKELGINSDDFMISVVSRGIPEKGWQEALDAVKKVRMETKRNVRLVFVGNGPEYERMKNISCDFADFVGFSSDIYSYFSAADLALLPSRFKGESFPLVVLEAFAVGTPVIATDIGEFRNMLTTPDGLAGEIIPIHDWQLDIDELKDAILRFINDEAFYQQRKVCVQMAKEYFSINNFVSEHEKFYAQAIQRVKEKQ